MSSGRQSRAALDAYVALSFKCAAAGCRIRGARRKELSMIAAYHLAHLTLLVLAAALLAG